MSERTSKDMANEFLDSFRLQGRSTALVEGVEALIESRRTAEEELATLRTEYQVVNDVVEALTPAAGLRASVLWFAQEMERRLRENDHKPGWKGDTTGSLIERIPSKLQFLRIDHEMKKPLAKRTADIANFAMMAAHNDAGNPDANGKPMQILSAGAVEHAMEWALAQEEPKRATCLALVILLRAEFKKADEYIRNIGAEAEVAAIVEEKA